MWSFLKLHTTAYGAVAVLRLGCYSKPVCLCRSHFSPRPVHGALQFLVHVDVVLHRGFLFPSHAGKVGWRFIALPSTPLPYLTVDQKFGSIFIFQIRRRRKANPATSTSITLCRISRFWFSVRSWLQIGCGITTRSI
jgi:hypothetical protein